VQNLIFLKILQHIEILPLELLSHQVKKLNIIKRLLCGLREFHLLNPKFWLKKYPFNQKKKSANKQNRSND
jgi:hypothetical protein